MIHIILKLKIVIYKTHNPIEPNKIPTFLDFYTYD